MGKAEAERRRVVGALVGAYVRRVRDLRLDECAVLELAPETWEPTPLFEAMIAREVARITGSKADQVVLGIVARDFLRWAIDHTKIANPTVLTKFAVTTAYDQALRSEVMYLLGENSPVVWWFGRENVKGSWTSVARWWPSPTGLFPPLAPSTFEMLKAATRGFASERVPEYIELQKLPGIKSTRAWLLDPVRPPLQAVRLAAELVRHHLGREPGTVVGVELGHSVAAQGLSVFLPRTTVLTMSTAYRLLADLRSGQVDGLDPLRRNLAQRVLVEHEPAEADAVILNIPSARQLGFLGDIADRARQLTPVPMTGRENDRYHRWPAHDPGTHTEGLVKLALKHLGQHGILVVLGDLESGVHHLAAKRIAREKTLAPITITTTGKTIIQVDYTTVPGRPLGVIPPSGRLISAWRRTTP